LSTDNKKSVPSHWFNRENKRHHNRRLNMNRGMYYRIKLLTPLLSAKVYREKVNCILHQSKHIIPLAILLQKKRTKPTSHIQIRQNMSLEPGLNSTLSRIYNSMICQAIHKSTHTRAYMPQRINGGRGIPILSTQGLL